MATNIFENAYFGKPYKTRDERKAIFMRHSDNTYHIYLAVGGVIFRYQFDGTYDDESRDLDIVSEWTEEINEKELDKLAEEYFLTTYNKGIKNPSLDIINEKEFAKADFKSGYRKAKEK